MAVTITQQPTTPNAAYTRLPYVVSGSTTVSNPQYQYVMDIYESGSSDKIVRVTQTKNPAGVAVFDPSRIFQGELGQDDNWTVSGSVNPINTVKTFEVKFGEQYGTSPSSSVTVYPNLDNTEIKVFSGVIDPNNGVSFNFITSSTNDILSNMPLGLDDPDVTSDVDRVKFVNKTDYHTVGVREAELIFISVFDRDSALLGTGSISVGDFGTLGIGPKNLLDYGGILSSSVANPIADLIVANIGENPDSLYELSIVPAHNDSPCDYENYVRFAWINRYGTWDYYNVYNPIRRQSDIERQSVTLPQVDYSSISSPYDINNRGQKDYYTQVKDVFEVTTEYVNKEVSNWLEELLDSPSVYVQRGDCFIPVVVTNAQYQHNNNTSRNKLFQYTIEFEPSNQPYGDWDTIPTSCTGSI